MSNKKDILLECIRDGRKMTWQMQASLSWRLAFPAILAQISTIACSYIDASMVGKLGANASAAIGIVSTTIWLLGGICGAAASGFSVQIAHLFGAKRITEARSVVRQSLIACLILSFALAATGLGISHWLPLWLGASSEIASMASSYFLIISLMFPIMQISRLSNSILRCSGNMIFPSVMGVILCVLDVCFNYILIPIYHTDGAALGTLLAELITGTATALYLLFISKDLKQSLDSVRHYLPTKECIKKALNIGLPMGVEHTVFTLAQIGITCIIAPLGAISIAANSFAITAEAVCYMFGYGISEAATTLVGQSVGAKRKKTAFTFGAVCCIMGMTIMTGMGIVMYILSPEIMAFLTPVEAVRELGTTCLRIESFAEPMFAASIVLYGVFVGAGDTLRPACMNLMSIWGARLVLAFILTPKYGLIGVWIAMCIELCFRGIIFIIQFMNKKWMKKI